MKSRWFKGKPLFYLIPICFHLENFCFFAALTCLNPACVIGTCIVNEWKEGKHNIHILLQRCVSLIYQSSLLVTSDSIEVALEKKWIQNILVFVLQGSCFPTSCRSQCHV